MAVTNLPIKSVVDVEISRKSSVQQQIDLSLLCVITQDITALPVSDRYRIYESLGEVEADFAVTTDEYKCAESFFGQNPSPAKIMFASVDVATETYVEAITEAYALKAFYGLAIVNMTLTNADILLISAYVQANTMIFFYQSSSPDILQSVTTDIASLLQALNYDRTTLWFNENSDTGAAQERLDISVASMGFSRQIGSFNWAIQSLTGVTSTSSTPTEIDIAMNKSVNFYVQVGGIPVTMEGSTSSNPAVYIDVIQASDWLDLNIQLNVFNVFVLNDKVGYDDAGVTAMANALKSVLKTAEAQRIISGNPKPTISVKPVSDVLASDKASRNYPYLSFSASLDDPINSVKINGTLLT